MDIHAPNSLQWIREGIALVVYRCTLAPGTVGAVVIRAAAHRPVGRIAYEQKAPWHRARYASSLGPPRSRFPVRPSPTCEYGSPFSAARASSTTTKATTMRATPIADSLRPSLLRRSLCPSPDSSGVSDGCLGAKGVRCSPLLHALRFVRRSATISSREIGPVKRCAESRAHQR